MRNPHPPSRASTKLTRRQTDALLDRVAAAVVRCGEISERGRPVIERAERAIAAGLADRIEGPPLPRTAIELVARGVDIHRLRELQRTGKMPLA